MHLIPKSALVLALLLGYSATPSSHAQPSDGPVYSRQRTGMQVGGIWNGGVRYGSQYRGHYGGYYPYQPAIAGSWYARPYPHHFDYYRWRYSTPQTPDCPCAKAQVEY